MTAVLAISPGAGHPPQGGGAKKNSYARVIGSAAAGVSELLLFHPVDTVAKRLMSNQSVAVKGQPLAEAASSLNKVSKTGGKVTICHGRTGGHVILYAATLL